MARKALPATALAQETTPSFDVVDGSYAALARELAQDIREAAEIIVDYGFTDLSDPRWKRLQQSHDFIHLLVLATREWNAADSTPKRIRYKALASLELVVAELHVIAMTHTSTERRLEAMKMIKSLAGFDSVGGIGSGGALDGGSGVSITINIGDKTVSARLSTPKTVDSVAEEVS